jgi:hypothetical protein
MYRSGLRFLLLVLLASSFPASVHAGTLLCAEPAKVNPGSQVKVSFDAGGLMPDSWVGFYREAAGNDSPLARRSLKDLDGGGFMLEAPAEPGRYNFRLFKDGGYDLLGTSNGIEVVQFRPVLEVRKLQVKPGRKITVSLGEAPFPPGCWIGFFREDGGNNSPISREKLGELKEGTYVVEAPKEPGKYNFRVFPDGGYDLLAASKPVEVSQYRPIINLQAPFAFPGDRITVIFSEAPELYDSWIGLFNEASGDNSALAYKYLRDLPDNTYTVDAPPMPGRYNFRIFLDSGYTLVGTSMSVEVRPQR